MNSALHIYSDILQLRTKAYLTLKYANGGMRYAVSMFIIVGLVAGAGLWIGLPALLQRPLLAERIDEVSALVDRFDQAVVPVVNRSLDAISREKLSIALGDALRVDGAVSSAALSDVINRAGMSAAQFAETLSAASGSLTGEARAQLEEQVATMQTAMESQGRVTPEQIDQLLVKTPLTVDQIVALLAQAASGQTQLDRLSAQTAQQAPQPGQFLAQIPLSAEQLQGLLAHLALAPERLSKLTLQLGLTPEQISRLRTDIGAAPDEVNAVLSEVRTGLQELRPPLGERFSRFVKMFGTWISTPLNLVAGWAFFGLMLLVVAKLLGGKGTVRQHLIGLLLAAAPLFLLFFTYVPDVAPAMPVSFTVAFDFFGRVLALVGTVWAFLILVKSMAVTHEFSLWRSFGAIILAGAVIYVILPVLSAVAIGSILRG